MDSLNTAMLYMAGCNKWMTSAEENIKILSQKYELAKQRIERDRSKIHDLQGSLSGEKQERRKLSDSLEKQCRRVNEAEKKADEAIKEKQALATTVKDLTAERDRLNADAAAFHEEIRALKQRLEALEAEQTPKDLKIAELEAEQVRLAAENTSLQETLAENEATLTSTAESVDALVYNIWKNKGVGPWMDDYVGWMKTIYEYSVREARRSARAAGTDFNKADHVATTFTDAEIAAVYTLVDPDATDSDTSSSFHWSEEASPSPKNQAKAGEGTSSKAIKDSAYTGDDIPDVPPVEKETDERLGVIASSPPPPEGPALQVSGSGSGEQPTVPGPTEADIYAGLPDLPGKVPSEFGIEGFDLQKYIDSFPSFQMVSPLRDAHLALQKAFGPDNDENPQGAGTGDGGSGEA